MTEVEKYGLFAVVAVASLVTAIAIWGGDDEVPQLEAASSGKPLAIAIQGGDPSGARARGQAARAAGNLPLVPAGKQTGGAANRGPGASQARPQAAKLHPGPAGSGNAGVHVKPLVAKKVPSAVPLDGRFQHGEQPQPYPGERSSVPAAPPAARTLTHTVASGETLSGIARAYLGSPGLWRNIVKLNPGLDPDRLQVGQVLVVSGPAPASKPLASASNKAPTKSAKAAAQALRKHTVAAGDNLGALAQRYLGTVRRSEELFQANRDVLASPDALVVGQVLRIPPR